MPLIKKSIESLEKDSVHLDVENEVMSKRAELAEKEAIIRQLKQQYGRDWKSILGVKGLLDLSSLRSLSRKPTGSNTNNSVSVLPSPSMRMTPNLSHLRKL